MEKEELTIEESDKKILEELNIEEESETTADENSTINEEEDDSTEEEESETESEEETQEDEEEEEEPKGKPNNFAKLLAKKNEAKREAEQANKEKEEAISQAQQLQARLDELEEAGDFGNEEYVNTMVEKKIAEREEVSDFFEEFEELKTHKKGILEYKKETGLNLEKATKLYLAETDPNLLLSPQSKAKKKAAMFETPGRTSRKLQTGKLDYSDAEFDSMVQKGLIKL